jgi:hypothetical protein
MVGEKAHEKLVAKVAAQAGRYLEDGETVKDALIGQTEAGPNSGLMGMIAAVRMITGKLQMRLVIVTDRNVYLAHSGSVRPSRIKEILVKHTREQAASLMSISYGVVRVDKYDVCVSDAGRKRAGQLVEAVAGIDSSRTPERSTYGMRLPPKWCAEGHPGPGGGQ